MKLINKILENHYNIAFCFSLLVSVGLMITSFILPPTGEIDPSVLKATGIIFLYPTLAFAHLALRSGKVATVKHKDTELTIGQQEQKKRQFSPISDSEEEMDA